MNSELTPLVSIIVITYNSAKFVLETLESVKSQTYENIELIISDDGSKDNTLEICNSWINDNKDRFVNIKLITVEKNSGIPANCNRGVAASKGEWIKIIAGDDSLIYDAISKFIFLVNNNNLTAKVIFGNAYFYLDTFDKNNLIIKESNFRYKNIFQEKLDPKLQYKYLLRFNPIIACSAFISSEVFLRISFDESFPFIEDRPFWINSVKSNFSILYVDEFFANYRLHSQSIQNHGDIFKKQVVRSFKFQKKYIYNDLSFIERFLFDLHSLLYKMAFSLRINESRILSIIYNYLIVRPIESSKMYFYFKNLPQ